MPGIAGLMSLRAFPAYGFCPRSGEPGRIMRDLLAGREQEEGSCSFIVFRTFRWVEGSHTWGAAPS